MWIKIYSIIHRPVLLEWSYSSQYPPFYLLLMPCIHFAQQNTVSYLMTTSSNHINGQLVKWYIIVDNYPSFDDSHHQALYITLHCKMFTGSSIHLWMLPVFSLSLFLMLQTSSVASCSTDHKVILFLPKRNGIIQPKNEKRVVFSRDTVLYMIACHFPFASLFF